PWDPGSDSSSPSSTPSSSVDENAPQARQDEASDTAGLSGSTPRDIFDGGTSGVLFGSIDSIILNDIATTSPDPYDGDNEWEPENELSGDSATSATSATSDDDFTNISANSSEFRSSDDS